MPPTMETEAEAMIEWVLKNSASIYFYTRFNRMLLTSIRIWKVANKKKSILKNKNPSALWRRSISECYRDNALHQGSVTSGPLSPRLCVYDTSQLLSSYEGESPYLVLFQNSIKKKKQQNTLSAVVENGKDIEIVT